ncbi:MAG: aminoacetone oxidase family FAD-binding enzyme [Candidatus Cloacimonadota bacterium]
MKTHEIIIIGAGPAGLLSAYAAGAKALVLEANPYAGKKLLLSGTGQCNFSNTLSKEDFLRALRDASHYLKPALYAFDQKAFCSLLEQYGCTWEEAEEHKLFPASRQSSSVRDALLKAALAQGATIEYGQKVIKVSRKKGGVFQIQTADETYSCKKLILSTGGQSWPQTGSDGSSYRFARSLGHKIIKLCPSLASVELDTNTRLGECSGLALRNVKICMCTDQGRIHDQGDILITHKGLSGPVILNNSYLMRSGTLIGICLVEDAHEALPALIKKEPRKQLQNALKLLNLSECLITAVLHRLQIDGSKILAELKADDRKLLANFLQNAVFNVKKVESMDTSMATAGGIDLREISSRNLESRACPGLYLTGEMLNYHAPTGGFNIQLAASTGFLAGLSAASKTD